MAEKTFEFKIIVNNERYYNEDTNYGVYGFTTDDNIPEYDVYKDPFEPDSKEVKMSLLTGRMQQLYIGSEYLVKAKLELNKRYNTWNYIPINVSSIMPKTIESQRKFLEAIALPRQVDSLLSIYPNIVQEVIDGREEIDYSKTKWIKQATWEKLKEKIINNYVISDILLLLQPLGVTFNMIKRLINNEPNAELLKRKLLDNPYMLTDIPGLGFKRVDDLALKIKPELRLSHQRVYAFLNYYLTETGDDEGHTWVKLDTLASAVRDNIYECEDLFEEVIALEKQNNSLLCFEDDKVGLKYYKSVELSIYNILKHIDFYTRKWNVDFEKGIEEAEKEQGFKLTEEQREVVMRAKDSNVVVISGKAGTGKSTLLRALLKVYKNYSIGCCALSAKAAQRITEATGRPAMTIHRLLGAKGLSEFTYNKHYRLPYDIIVLDESSMVNAQIFYDLVSAVKEGAKLIMCGDNRQLPPIGYANVFSDILEMKNTFNVNQLTKVMRQAEMSGILSDANKIREGISPIEQPELKIVTGELQDMYYMFRDNREALNNISIKTYLKTIEEIGIDDAVIAVPRRKDCINSTQEINVQIQDALFSKETPFIQRGSLKFRQGAKVLQIANNYEKYVFNGDIGYIKDIWTNEKTGKECFSIDFKDKVIEYTKSEINQIELAYAMTVHKCIPKDTLILSNKGIIEIKDLDNDALLYEQKPIVRNDTSVFNGSCLEKPSHYYNAGASLCYKFTTERGYEIITTSDHKLDVLRQDGHILPQIAQNIKVNDVLILCANSNVYGSCNTIPKSWHSNINIRPQTVMYKLPNMLDQNFAKFLGYMVGDGCVFKKGFRFAKEHKEVVEDFKELVFDLFGYQGVVEKNKKHNFYSITVSSTYIASFLLNIDGIQPRQKFVPQIIMQAPKNIQCSFLKGLFEDGTVNIKKTKNGLIFDHIELSIKNEKLKQQLQIMLLNMGIITSSAIKITDKKKGFFSYNIYIYKKEARIFATHIGFVDTIKQNNLQKCFDDSSISSERKAIPYIVKIISELNKNNNIKFEPSIWRCINTRKKITVSLLKKYLDKNNHLQDNLDYQYLKFFTNKYYPDKVKKIELVEADTVCITMPETHKFIQNGFFGWNCQGSGYHTVIGIVDATHHILLDSCMLYTMITRAKKRCLLLAEPSAFKKCINNNKSIGRQTWLSQLNK